MGLLYWNIINTLIKNDKYNNKLIFSVIGKDIDVMYSLPLEYFIENYGVKKSISFENGIDYLKEFKIIVDGKETYIKINSLPREEQIISYKDNKDTPLRNSEKMSHTPILIIENKIIKLPEYDILKFDNNLNKLFTFDDLKQRKHGRYNLITNYTDKIRTIKDIKNVEEMCFDKKYQQHLTNNSNIDIEYKYLCSFIKYGKHKIGKSKKGKKVKR